MAGNPVALSKVFLKEERAGSASR